MIATANVSGNASTPYPLEILNIRIIQRPNNAAVYDGDEYLSVGYVSYNGTDMIPRNSSNSTGGKGLMSSAISQLSKISFNFVLFLSALSLAIS